MVASLADIHVPRKYTSITAGFVLLHLFYARVLGHDMADDRSYMFVRCINLERLSIKNATWDYPNGYYQPVSQDMLIKMVRNHPTLQWLRSDLTTANIAMLQREPPRLPL